MIPQTEAVRQAVDTIATHPVPWQQALAQVVRDRDELLAALGLDPDQAPYELSSPEDFPTRVPWAFGHRMHKGDWYDPLLLQVLALGQEQAHQPGFVNDPLEESAASPVKGLIHKYHGRVLLVASGGCAIHCRYCFRRHFPYQEQVPGRRDWSEFIDYIGADASIREVILSGGDPLVASDSSLLDLVQQLADIPHLDTLRIHTRLPIVIPQRIDRDCLHWMTATRLKPVLVVHCNHAREIDDSVISALQQLRRAGVITLNQAVLLAGINDTSDQLVALSKRLFEADCLPYYLHLLDRVRGAAHYDVPEQQALQLVNTLQAQLPGYLVPRLVRELPGAASKVPVTPGSLEQPS